MLRKLFLFIVLLALGTGTSFAQDEQPLNLNRNGVGNPNSFNTTNRDTSTVKKRKGTILNDSLKIIYGPHTTFHFYEEDWFNNSNRLYITDTSLNNFHHYNFTQRYGNRYHDLGNLATPGNEVFLHVPTTIGTRQGIHAFDYLKLDENSIQQMNTRSPYSSWYYVQGGEKRSFLDASLAQNINERVNVGVLYRRITNSLLLGTRRFDSNTRQTDRQSILFKGNGTSKNGRYKIASFVNFSRHRLVESGGLNYESTLQDLDTLFQIERRDLALRLSEAGSIQPPDAFGLQQDNTLHIYHQYTLIDSSNLQLYHIFDWTTKKHTYEDSNIDTISQIYEDFYLDGENTAHNFQYVETDHRLGIKWRNKRLFMAAYYRYKNFTASHKAQNIEQLPYDLQAQHFLGFVGNYTINDTTQLAFEGEQLLFNDYRLAATLKTKFLTAKYERTFYSPSLFDQYYYGNHFNWSNNFDNTLVDMLEGSIQIPLKNHFFQPYVRFTNAIDYVYLNEDAVPTQANSSIILLQAGLKIKGRLLDKFTYNGEFIYTENRNETALQVPQLFTNFQIAYENLQFLKGKLPIQLGLDFHWKSAYFADAYMPVTQSFFRQNLFQVENFPVLDVFVNARVNRTRLFLKGTNLISTVLGKGYFSTINYMAQPTQVEFGVHWMFFD